MDDYDSDSSGGGDDIETNVLLGYASKEATDDTFSQLGGHPTWLDDETPPDGSLAKCKVCNGWMNLLMQLNGDLPARFAGHERRLYLMTCKRKACRRKDGSVRGFRATRIDPSAAKPPAAKDSHADSNGLKSSAQSDTNVGNTLFGVKSSGSMGANPFASTKTAGSSKPSNPFAPAPSTSARSDRETSSAAETLPQTFADKVRIGSTSTATTSADWTDSPAASEPWPEISAFPPPYPRYYLDADKEFLEPESGAVPSNARVDRSEGGGSASEEKSAFESSMDKTFQRFADRLAQNPEQVLRYEFGGQPLLYSKTDAVGRLLGPMQDSQAAHVQTAQGRGGSRIPRCGNCGAERVLELQLTPHAITELESEEMSLEGMDWGTIILGVCSKDCLSKRKRDGEVGYSEEWVGVQWEEVVKQGRAPA